MKSRLLTAEQKRKYDFVRTTLSGLLREALNNQHYVCEYYIDEHCAEWIDVTFDNEYRIFRVGVTSANLLEMTQAVLKHVGR